LSKIRPSLMPLCNYEPSFIKLSRDMPCHASTSQLEVWWEAPFNCG
jgi:hypothetical protein